MIKKREQEKGVALLMVMVIFSILATISVVLFEMVKSENTNVNATLDEPKAYYLAETAADRAIVQWKEYVAEYNNADKDKDKVYINCDAIFGADSTLPSIAANITSEFKEAYSLDTNSDQLFVDYEWEYIDSKGQPNVYKSNGNAYGHYKEINGNGNAYGHYKTDVTTTVGQMLCVDPKVTQPYIIDASYCQAIKVVGYFRSEAFAYDVLLWADTNGVGHSYKGILKDDVSDQTRVNNAVK